MQQPDSTTNHDNAVFHRNLTCGPVFPLLLCREHQPHQQVTAVRTSKEAFQCLSTFAGEGRPFDLVLKEHEPPQSNACRFMLRMSAQSEHFRHTPVVGEW